MAYLPDIPQAQDDPSQSQGQLLANFQELNTFLSVNHLDLNAAGQGKHKFMQMPEQSSAPTTAADEGALYTKVVSGLTQLFFRTESDGAENQITGAFTASSTGSVTIAGGITLKWGSGNANSATFSSAYATSIFAVVVGSSGAFTSSDARLRTKSLTGFTLEIFAKFEYIAIGI